MGEPLYRFRVYDRKAGTVATSVETVEASAVGVELHRLNGRAYRLWRDEGAMAVSYGAVIKHQGRRIRRYRVEVVPA